MTGTHDTASDERHALLLDDFADLPRWVAWRQEIRKKQSGDRKLAKLPYDPHTRSLALIPTDPSTWGTRKEAEQRWAQLNDGRPGGVGIVLGDLDDGTMLMGLDLDECIDANNQISEWACAILDRFNSYCEVSPSGTGVKAFFLIAADEAAAVGRLLADKTRTPFSAGPHQEIAIDRARFYAVTGVWLSDWPETLTTVSVDAVRWFVEEAGPNYLAMHGVSRERPKGQSGGNDESGSGHGFRFLSAQKAAGKSFEEACTAILADQGPAGEWARERADERQLRRAYDRAPDTPTDTPIDTSTDTIVLSANDPLEWVQEFVRVTFACDQANGVVHYRGSFYAFTGSHYEECDDDHLRSQAYEFLSKAVLMSIKGTVVSFKPDINKVNKLIDALRASVNEKARRQTPFWLDGREGPDPANFLACRNGLLDITTRELLPHTPWLFNVNALPFDYQRDAPIPARWMQFLDELWLHDKEAENTLQEMFGLLLTSDTSHQKIFMIVGPKRSGKGTISGILTALVGKANTTPLTLASLSGEQFGLQELIDKRVCIISDARLGGRSNGNIVAERLLSISGEDAVSINRKYKSYWTGKLGARFLIMSNELPRIPDASGAFASRFILLTLTNSFYGNEDPTLSDKLKRELPGILNWALDGLNYLRERGHFENPQSSRDMLEELDDLSSPIRTFLRERCTIGLEQWIEIERSFNVWKFWCEDHGVYPGTSSMFGRDLRAAVPNVRVVKQHGVRGYLGVGLSHDDEDEHERRRR